MAKNYFNKREKKALDPEEGRLSVLETTPRKIIAIALIILVIVIILVLSFAVLSQNNNSLIYGSDGNTIGGIINISKDGQLISTTTLDGGKLQIKGNPNDLLGEVITPPGMIRILKNPDINLSIKLVGKDGQISIRQIQSENYFIDDNGNVHFTINPFDDLDLSQYYDENMGEYILPDGGLDAVLRFVFADKETNEEIMVDIPFDFVPIEFNQEGCLALNRSSVNGVTYNGTLTTPAKIRVGCDTQTDIVASIEWQSERMGNVEIVTGSYETSIVLLGDDQLIMTKPVQGIYDVKIIFVPFEEYAGKAASFTLKFGLGKTDKADTQINFLVLLENLEQCVKITPRELVIPKDAKSTTLEIDTSSCYSRSMEIKICDSDPGCSAGTEGGVTLDQTYFTLTKNNPKRTVTIQRKDMPGAYGITIDAKPVGFNKIFLEEKPLLVEPRGTEGIIPDKFEVSLLNGAKDSIVLTNDLLAEDVDVRASICSVYESSLDVKTTGENYGLGSRQNFGLNSWWKDLATNGKRYAGEGKYQAAIVNTLAELDYLRATTQVLSAQHNSNIKRAYLDLMEVQPLNARAVVIAANSVKQAELLKDKIEKTQQFAEANLVMNIASIISSLAGLTASGIMIQTSVSSISGSVQAVNACNDAAVKADLANLTKTVTHIQAGYGIYLGYIATAITSAGTIKNTYESIDKMMQDTKEINGAGAVNSTKLAQTNLINANEKANSATENIQKALAAAAIDGFSSASKDDADAKRYLELAKQDMVDVNTLTNTALENQLTANNLITTKIADLPSDADLIMNGVTMLVNLLVTVGLIQTQAGQIDALMKELANVDFQLLNLDISAAFAECAENESLCPCGGALAASTSLQALSQSNSLQHAVQVANVVSVVSVVSTVYSIFQTVYTMMNDYSQEFINTQTQFNNETTAIYDMVNANNRALASLEPAIESADWLSKQEEKSSLASSYSDQVVELKGEFNKKRLTALIGEAISNGFINGAYEGGVYTTKPTQFTQSASPVSSANTAGNTITTWVNEVVNTISGGKPNESSNQAVHLANDETIKEDCLNTVEVTFPDYMINLIQDSRPIITKTSGVSAVWNFSDAKVNDVFEQQEVGAIFLNSGLKQNTYGVVEFPAIKHTHAKPTEIKTTFGPFNIPDAQVDEVSFKYHFRFNATPRTSTNYYPIEKNICTSGIKRGATGSSALPRTVLSWDWNSITESSTSNLFIEKMQPVGTTNQNDLNLGYNYYNTQIGKGGENEPFIDATQLSILLSKKMASLENILSANNLSCPVNPAKEVLLRVKPEIDTTDSQLPIFGGTSAQSYCYLPLTTRSFDGKPALYYYFENTQNLAGPNDSDYLQTLQRFNELIDFNANLILDGYGLDMQYDFAGSYGTKLFAASPSFMNASTGIKRYFEDKDRLYFSSLANWREPILRWALPDAGKYRIRMIIDFLDNPLLFQSTIPSAKIINDLYLVEPINSNYGPMYYVPFDGPTGLNANNNRRSYGTTLSGVSGLINVVKQEGAYITPTQKDALVKLDALKITNPVLLNYSPSIRSKLLELGFFSNSAYPRGYGTYFNYSPTTATPLLFELNGFTGANTNYLYSLSRDNIGYVPKSPSLFLLSSVGNCTDLAGNKLNKYMNQTPDLQIGTKFGVIFDKAKASGKTYLKTIAYAPAEDIYGIEQGAGGKIYSPNTLFTESKTVWLNGVNGMEYNDTSIGTTINSIQSLFDAVRKGEVCVSRSGVSETYWWPEQQLYNANGENGHTLQQKINDAATGCS